MVNVSIDRFDIDDYKKTVSSALGRKFYREKSHVVGLVSPVDQDMALYFDDFSIHQFELSAWRTDKQNDVARGGLTVYRVVKGGGDEDSLSDIPSLSFVQLTVHLDKKSQTAIFCEGEILSQTPDQKLGAINAKLQRLCKTFIELKCSHQNNYEARLDWNERSVSCTFRAGQRTPISKLLIRAYSVVEPRKAFYKTIEKVALNELFELKQKGWFAETDYAESNFVSEMASGRVDSLTFEERRFSVWYRADQLFEGCRIIFEGAYNDGVVSASLYGNVGDKRTLLSKLRPFIQTERFSKFYANGSGTEFSAKVSWLDTRIRLCFTSFRGKIRDQELEVAGTLFQNQQDWQSKAYNYAVERFLELKNVSWRQSDEPELDAAEFEALLGDFAITTLMNSASSLIPIRDYSQVMVLRSRVRWARGSPTTNSLVSDPSEYS